MQAATLLAKVRSRVARIVRRSNRLSNERDTARITALERHVPVGGVGAEIGVHKGCFTERLLTQLRPTRLHLLDPWYLGSHEWNWGPPDRSTINALRHPEALFE